MIIGVDFDNTIVSYDALFHRLAVERELIPASVPPSKEQVRNFLRRAGREDEWTELQGYVYGARMADAAAFPGVRDFFTRCRQTDTPVYIISHKTRTPFRGPAYDLHEAARGWLALHGFCSPSDVGLPGERVFFETTLAAKLARIGQLGCTHFIDDLPELLAEPEFPNQTQPILFDPNRHHTGQSRFQNFSEWSALEELLLCSAGGRS